VRSKRFAAASATPAQEENNGASRSSGCSPADVDGSRLQLRVVPARPTRPNEQWCMDFMADRLEDGRRIRILTVEDVFTRECLAVEADVSLISARVVNVLERLVGERAAR